MCSVSCSRSSSRSRSRPRSTASTSARGAGRPAAEPAQYARGVIWLVAILANLALLGALRGALGNGLGLGLFTVASLAVASELWWFRLAPLAGEVRARVLVPTGVITGVAMTAYGESATIWMPDVVTSNEAQFGFFGIALALVTWFSGAAICVLVGACAGPVLAEDTGRVGQLIRGGEPSTLKPGARPSLPPPARDLTLRGAFQARDDSYGAVGAPFSPGSRRSWLRHARRAHDHRVELR